MIYLDNAATTYPKPQLVASTVAMAMKKFGATPGRNGYNISIVAATEPINGRTLNSLYASKN